VLRQHRRRRLRQGPTSHRIITHIVNRLVTAATFATAGVARDLLLQAPSQLPRSATCSCVRAARSSVRASARAARRPQPQKRHANSTAAHRHANSTGTQQHHHHHLKAQPPTRQCRPLRENRHVLRRHRRRRLRQGPTIHRIVTHVFACLANAATFAAAGVARNPLPQGAKLVAPLRHPLLRQGLELFCLWPQRALPDDPPTIGTCAHTSPLPHRPHPSTRLT
jgi:hypothetical protein